MIGPRQSGSTRVFNVARLVGEVAGLTVRAHWDIQKQASAPSYDVDVAKVHTEYNGAHLRRLYNVVILPIRDLRDTALSSMARKFIPRRALVRFCSAQANCINRLIPHATLVLRYETFGAHAVRRIANAMRVHLKPPQVKTVLRKIDALYRSKELPSVDDRDNSLYQRTLMSRAHNTANGRSNKWQKVLTPCELHALRKTVVVSQFLKRFGYQP